MMAIRSAILLPGRRSPAQASAPQLEDGGDPTMGTEIMKYPRTPHWPGSPASTGDSRRVHQNPSRFVGQDIVITEKLDGANTLLHRGKVYGRSVSTPRSHPWQAMVRKWHAWKLVSEPELLLWGEDIYATHSIAYGPVLPERTFYAFAAMTNHRFLPFDHLVDITERLDIPTVPVLFRGVFHVGQHLADFINSCHKQSSALGGDREGVVVRIADGYSYDEFSLSVCKSVRHNHVQTDSHWTRSWVPCQILRSDPRRPSDLPM